MDEIGICLHCGLSHAAERRHDRLRRMLPATTEQILERYPCLYRAASGAGNSMFRRDLKAVGAVRVADMNERARERWGGGLVEWLWTMTQTIEITSRREEVAEEAAELDTENGQEQAEFAFAADLGV